MSVITYLSHVRACLCASERERKRYFDRARSDRKSRDIRRQICHLNDKLFEAQFPRRKIVYRGQALNTISQIISDYRNTNAHARATRELGIAHATIRLRDGARFHCSRECFGRRSSSERKPRKSVRARTWLLVDFAPAGRIQPRFRSSARSRTARKETTNGGSRACPRVSMQNTGPY